MTELSRRSALFAGIGFIVGVAADASATRHADDPVVAEVPPITSIDPSDYLSSTVHREMADRLMKASGLEAAMVARLDWHDGTWYATVREGCEEQRTALMPAWA